MSRAVVRCLGALAVLWAGALCAVAQNAGIESVYELMDAGDWAGATERAKSSRADASNLEERITADIALAVIDYATAEADVAIKSLQNVDAAIIRNDGLHNPERFDVLEYLADVYLLEADNEGQWQTQLRLLNLAVYHQEWEVSLAALDVLVPLASQRGLHETAALFASDLYDTAGLVLGTDHAVTQNALFHRASAHLALGQVDLALAVAPSAGTVPRSAPAQAFQRSLERHIAAQPEPEVVRARLQTAADALQLDLMGTNLGSTFDRFNAALENGDLVQAEVLGQDLITRASPGDAYPIIKCLQLAYAFSGVDPERHLHWVDCLAQYPVAVLAATADVTLLFDTASDAYVSKNQLARIAVLRTKAVDIATLLYGADAAWTQRLRFKRAEAHAYARQFDLALLDIETALRQPEFTETETLFDLHLLRGRIAQGMAQPAVAETAYLAAGDILRTAGLTDDPRWAVLLDDIADLQGRLGNDQDAEAIARRKLAESLALYGEGSEQVFDARMQLGGALREAGHLQEAVALLEQTRAGFEQFQGHDAGLMLAWNLTYASALRDVGRTAEAEAILAGAVPMLMENAAFLDDPMLAMVYLRVLAKQAWQSSDYPLALQVADMALDILPAQDPFRVEMYELKGRVAIEQGRNRDALAMFRLVSTEMAKPGRARLEGAQGIYPMHIEAALRVGAESDPAELASYLEEALGISQTLNALGAGAAIAQAATRWETAPELSAVVRRLQDTEAELANLNAHYASSLAQGQSGGAISTKLQDATLRHQELRQTVAQNYPDYATAVSPQAVPLQQIGTWLSPEEALIVFATSDETNGGDFFGSTVIAISHSGIMSASTKAQSELKEMAIALRCQAALSDPNCANLRNTGAVRGSVNIDAPREGTELPVFDLELAHQAYSALLAPVEPVIAGKERLIIVPDSALVSVPFHTLVRSAPDMFTTLQDADWLIRDAAVFVVPTIASLDALRTRQRVDQTEVSGFLGVGDPLIGEQRNGPIPYACAEEPVLMAQAKTEANGPVLRNGAGDVQALAAMAALPETRCELQAAARYFGMGSHLLLQGDATETEINRLNATGALARYRTISFATHGLIAGEVGDLDAGIVLTPPGQATAQDDGILTTGDIAQLTLNADMVLLSACNTAAGSGENSEGLSGLASAFFYAGARSLLVSHWPVDTNAAAALNIDMLKRRSQDASIGYAEALRQSMLAIIDDPFSSPQEMHPGYWAPFMVVGEGAG